MNCTFYRPEEINLKEFDNIVKKMEADLTTLIAGKNEPCEVYSYVLDLVSEAKPLANNSKMCFWGLAEPNTMPSDARHHYFYWPTYIGTAFLMQAILKYPELEDGEGLNWEFGYECIYKLREILPKVMLGCTGRGFKGHGYDSLKEQLDVIVLFLSTGVLDFVKKYPEVCTEFTTLLHNTLDSYREKIKKGETRGTWGEDYADRMKQVLSLVKG